MDFKDYQKKAKKTALYPTVGGQAWVYPALGLSGETGEIANKLKKIIRDNGGEIDVDTKLVIKDELGDVLWYVSQLASELGLDLDEIAKANIAKLADRNRRGKIKGSGDNR